MNPILRPYQEDVLGELKSVVSEGKRRIIIQAPCGAGKTIIASDMIRHAVSSGRRVLFLAHRRELIWQTSDKLKKFEVEHGVLVPGEPYDYGQLCVIASIQTLHARTVRRKSMEAPEADLVIVDEFHHAFSSKSWQKILDFYPTKYIVGLTATPINVQGKGMGHMADAMVKCPSIKQLTDEGYLVPAKYFCPSLPDLEKLKVVAGDYVQDQLQERMDQPKLIGDIVENWARIAPDRKTIVFASGVKHSINIMNEFNKIGVKAEHIDGGTDSFERDEIIKRFEKGETQVLCNCAVFSEGFDCPSASALVFARPTKSLLLYLQVAGRILRTSEGKKDAIIIDHAGIVYEHGMVDQDWNWELDYGQGKTASSISRTKRTKEPKPITCEKCKCVYEKRLSCPLCGTKPTVKGKVVDTWEAYLKELNASEIPEKNPQGQQIFYRQLLGYAHETGKRPGWAFYKYQDKFHAKPAWSWRNLPAIEPSLEVRSWIRSRNIAWAKSRRNPSNQQGAN